MQINVRKPESKCLDLIILVNTSQKIFCSILSNSINSMLIAIIKIWLIIHMKNKL